MSAQKPANRIRSTTWFVLRWIGRMLLAVVLFYSGFLALGCVPVNREFESARSNDRVVIYVSSNEIHTDLVLPVVHQPSRTDWRTDFPPKDFQADVSNCEYVAIGWGNRAFYIDTPTWADFKLRTAARALFLPSDSVLHIEYVPGIYSTEALREVHITAKQYERLVEFVHESIARGESNLTMPASERTYHTHDRFYESTGHYHAFNTCNQWTGRGLKRAGVKTGLWTPLKPQVLCWLERP